MPGSLPQTPVFPILTNHFIKLSRCRPIVRMKFGHFYMVIAWIQNQGLRDLIAIIYCRICLKNVIRSVKIVHSELPTTISSRRKKDPDVTPLPPLSPDLIWSFVSGKETSKFFDVDSIESADTTGRINAQWAHSSKIRSLCLMKLSSKTFQNFLPRQT